MRRQIPALTLFIAICLVGSLPAEPLAEPYLLAGNLTEGEKVLNMHLAANPKDDEARFGLGTIQFLLTFEHLGTSLYKHGLRTERAFPGMARQVRELLPQNPDPKEITYKDVRRIVHTMLDDLQKAEATLAKIKAPEVKLPLHVALIKVDLFGVGKPINAAFVLGQIQPEIPEDEIKNFVIGFDRGDVNWLRGYCHLLSAWGELILAVDSREMFDRTAHLFFEKVDTPHKFLLEEERNFETTRWWNRALFSDIVAFIHLMRFPLAEPKRMQASLDHLEAAVVQAREMWQHYNGEMDDDNEWIPNPSQEGVLRVEVTEEMVTTWLMTIDEANEVLAGKKLIPFWRGNNEKRGVNLRRVFTEPRDIDPILWIQGTAATPYLEKGPITEFANARTLAQLSRTFGGMNFIGFAFWFN